MVTYSDVLQDVSSFIHDTVELPEDYIDPSSRLQDIGIDSLDCIDLLCCMEDKYAVQLNEKDKQFYEACAGTVMDITVFFVNIINEAQNERSDT